MTLKVSKLKGSSVQEAGHKLEIQLHDKQNRRPVLSRKEKLRKRHIHKLHSYLVI